MTASLYSCPVSALMLGAFPSVASAPPPCGAWVSNGNPVAYKPRVARLCGGVGSSLLDVWYAGGVRKSETGGVATTSEDVAVGGKESGWDQGDGKMATRAAITDSCCSHKRRCLPPFL